MIQRCHERLHAGSLYNAGIMQSTFANPRPSHS